MKYFSYLQIISSLQKVMKNIKLVFVLIFILCLLEGLLTSISITSIIPILSTLNENESVSNFFLKDLIGRFYLEFEDLIIILAIILLFKIIIVICRKIVSIISAEELRSLLHSYILESILSKDYSNLMKFPRGELIEKLARNTDSTSMMIFKITNLLSNFVIIVVLIITSILVNFYITMSVILFFIIIYILIIKSYLDKVNKIGKQKTIKQENLTSLFSSIIFSIKEVYLLNSKKFFLRKIKKKTDSLKKTRIQSKFFITLPQDLIEFLFVFLIATVFIFFNYENAIKDYLPNLIFFFLIFYKLYQSSINFVKEIANIESIKYAYTNIYDEFIKDFKSKNVEQQVEINEDIFSRIIRVSKLYFSFYSTQENKDITLLKNVNIKIQRRKITQIIGQSGSGKTTLLDLLVKLYNPSKGNIYFDEKNINEINTETLRKNIGYVTQNCSLFEGNVMENIVLDKKFVKTKMNEIMSICDLDKMNYKKLVKDGGKNLSGGEIKRISLARALYHEPEVIIIDETFSSVDEKSEEKIIKQLRKKKFTVILISHRMSSQKYVDKIYNIN